MNETKSNKLVIRALAKNLPGGLDSGVDANSLPKPV